MPLTLTSMQPLLAQFKGNGLLASCYVDLSAPPGVRLSWPGSFKPRAAAVKELLAGDPSAWRQFEHNFQAIGRTVAGLESSSTRGVAVFAALQRGFFLFYPLEVPVENDLVVHEAPYLVPLLRALYQQREYLVVLSDTHRGRLYAATPGGVRLVREVEGHVPSKQHSAGERWGKQQATIARHREQCILHYQKDLVERIDHTWAEHPFQGLVLLGEHEVVEHVRKRLPVRLATQVVHEGPHPWTEDPLAVAETMRGIVAEVGRAGVGRLAEGLRERLEQGYAVAVGPRAVVEALQTGRVGSARAQGRGYGCVVLGPDPREVVARCAACRSLFVEMPTTCPLCQAPCVDANLREEVLLLTLRHDVAAHFLTNDMLAHCGGMVAVLSAQGVPGREDIGIPSGSLP